MIYQMALHDLNKGIKILENQVKVCSFTSLFKSGEVIINAHDDRVFCYKVHDFICLRRKFELILDLMFYINFL